MDSIQYLRGIKDNDRAIIQAIYTKCFPIIAEYVNKNSGKTEDAKDVFQDAMIVIFKQVNRQDGLILTTSFESYVYSISRFIWLKKLKKNSKEVITSEFSEEYVDENSWEDTLLEVRKRKLFKFKLEGLSEKCKKLRKMSFNTIPGKETAK